MLLLMTYQIHLLFVRYFTRKIATHKQTISSLYMNKPVWIFHYYDTTTTQNHTTFLETSYPPTSPSPFAFAKARQISFLSNNRYVELNFKEIERLGK